MRVAYYTAGDLGAGHLVRGVAIERGLRRRGFDGHYRMIGPALPYPVATRADYVAVTFTPEDVEDPARALESPVGRALVAFDPDLVIVDMFWAPLQHILPRLRAEAWLLLRACPAAWFTPPGRPQVVFRAEHYARVIGIEPFERPAVRERIDPIVVANEDDKRPAGELRARLGVGAGERLVVVVHAGVREEGALLLDRARVMGGEPRALDLHADGAPFPVAEWLGDADVIVAAAGYNTYWESRWLGHAARTIHLPMPRRIDDQSQRMEFGDRYEMRANGADVLARSILG